MKDVHGILVGCAIQSELLSEHRFWKGFLWLSEYLWGLVRSRLAEWILMCRWLSGTLCWFPAVSA